MDGVLRNKVDVMSKAKMRVREVQACELMILPGHLALPRRRDLPSGSNDSSVLVLKS